MAIESHPKDSRYQIITPETNQTIPSIMCHDAAHGGLVMKGNNDMDDVNTVVRRLTPLECERLQGFPDGWTDIGEWVDSKGKKHKEADSPRYKALGNSIALPYWKWLMKKIAKQYDRPIRLGSLFDGIGGFPIAVKEAGGEPVWASEIEEFPIAVTKKHFPEKETNK